MIHFSRDDSMKYQYMILVPAVAVAIGCSQQSSAPTTVPPAPGAISATDGKGAKNAKNSGPAVSKPPGGEQK